MSLFFESIRLVNGRVMNLSFHQQRVNTTCKAFNMPIISLKEIIHIHQHSFPKEGVFKMRIEYGYDISTVQLAPYRIKEIRILQLLDVGNFSYNYKSSNRTLLQSFYEKKRNADDCLLVKNGCITDTTYGSILLFKSNQWFTPSTILLPSTMRSKLLNQKKIKITKVTVENLYDFEFFKVVNAMRPFSLVRRNAIQYIYPS